MTDPIHAISLRGLGKRFDITDQAQSRGFLATSLRLVTGRESHRPLWALRGVDLDVERGETIGVIGPNGSGKTTLLLLVAGLLAPTEGSVEVRGRVDPFFQLAAGLHPRFTVLENFSICAALLGIPSDAYRRTLPAIVEFSGLEEYLHAKFGELSSGLAARVAFSVAVHADLDIILIDEALAVGDKPFQAKCRAVFDGFRRQGKTLVIVSQDPGALERMCSRVLYLREGRAVCCSEPRESAARFWSDIYRAAPAAPAGPGAGDLPGPEAAPAPAESPVPTASPAPVAPQATPDRRPRVEIGRLSMELRGAMASCLGLAAEDVFTMAPHHVPAFVGHQLNGTGLMAPGDEVILPANSPPRLVDVVLRNGWVPVVVDIVAGHRGLDLALAAEAVSPRTKALAVIHDAGVCDMDEAGRLASERGLVMIEHGTSPGSEWKGRPAGTFGRLGIFDFAHLLGRRTDLGLSAVAVRSGPGARTPALPPLALEELVSETSLLAEALEALRTLPDRVEESLRLQALCRRAFASRGEWFSLPPEDRRHFAILFTAVLRPDAPLIRPELLSMIDDGGRPMALASRDRNILHHPFYAGIPHRRPGPLPNTDAVTERGVTLLLFSHPPAVLEALLTGLGKRLAAWDGGPAR